MRKAAPAATVTAFALLVVQFCVESNAGFRSPQARSATVSWSGVMERDAAWYGTDEAHRIADNVLLYQRDSGGWPKNIDMAMVLTASAKASLLKQKEKTDSTIDNGATYTQLRYLARVNSAQPVDRYKQAFVNGIEYLLKAQYANGGWPQYYPLNRGYYSHITYNDGAMIGVMELLRDIAQKKSSYAFVDDNLRTRAATAVERGVECILKTQVVVDNQPTVWCAQHDEVTFKPAAARAFEPVSLSGLESVGVVRFLMRVEKPNQKIITSVEAAIAWFEKTRINGFRWQETPSGDGFDRVLIRDPNSGQLWARFYEIGTNRPIFIGRDGVIHYDISEIEAERRNGYRWYTDDPEKLLKVDYPAWRNKRSAMPAVPQP